MSRELSQRSWLIVTTALVALVASLVIMSGMSIASTSRLFARVGAPLPQPARLQPDDRLVMTGGSQLPETLDPALLRDAESSFIARQVFRGLVKLDNDLLARPDLASSIDVSPDGLRYTFTLKENAVFHDGGRIDASAVVASFNRATDPEIAGGNGYALPAAIYLNDIAGADARLSGKAASISGLNVVSDAVLEITLERPSASFLYKLTGSPAAIVDVVDAERDEWWMAPNGSGPFQLTVDRDSRIDLARFDGFYDGVPTLAAATLLFGAEAAQPLNLYERGEVDIVDVPFYALDRVSSPSDPLYPDLVIQPQLSTTYLAMNPNVAPFDDPNVRRAIAQAIDREKIVEVMFAGTVTAASGLVPPGILDREWTARSIPYDVASAAALWPDDGVDPEPEFYGGMNLTIAQLLQRDLDIEANAIGLDWPELTARLQEQSLPAYSLSWIADFPDPANFLEALFHSRSPDNYIGYANADVDRLLDDAAVEPDAQRRVDLYLEVQQLIVDDAVLVPLYHDVSYTLVKPRVEGLTITPIGILSLESVTVQ